MGYLSVFNWRLIIQSELEPFIQSGGSEVKASARNAGDPSLFPGSGRSPGEGNGNPLKSTVQYSCLENPRDGGSWWAAVYEFAQSQTRLK